jgi:hypothetical protein
MVDFKKDSKIKKNTGRYYWNNDKKAAWVEITTLTLEEINKISEECTTDIVDFAVHPETGILTRVESVKVDRIKRGRLLISRAISNWGGFSVDGGPDLDCTAENIQMLFNEFIEWRTWIVDCVKKHKDATLKLYGSISEPKN